MTQQEVDARFRALYERCFRFVLSYFRRTGFSNEEAKDLTQETFLRVYPYMKSIRGKSRAEEDAYVRVTAASVRINELRSKTTQGRAADVVSLDSLPNPEIETAGNPMTQETLPTPEELLGRKQERAFRRKRLYREIYKLPSTTRCCLLLQLAGLKYQEIADAMNISLDAVKSLRYDAKKRLTKALGTEIDWPVGTEANDD